MHFLDEFERAADGTFSITLAAEPHPGNWIQLPAGAHSLLVRRVLYDWDTEEVPHIAIERIGAEVSAAPRCLRTPTAAEIGEQIDALGTLIAQNADYWVDFVHSFRDEGDNVVPPPRPLPGTGMNDTRSSVKGFFSLADDEALVVEFEPPSGLFWSICLGDIWFRTIDYSHHQTSLNGHQVTIDPDGRCRVVIAHRDPGVANWLDTTDHRHGVICLRWVRVDRRPEVHTRVVPFAEIDESLHTGTARVAARGAGRRARAPSFGGRAPLGGSADDAMVLLDGHARSAAAPDRNVSGSAPVAMEGRMDIRQFDAGIGVEVRNVDVCDPDDRLFDELQTLFDTETLLVFRDQRLTYEQGRDLFARFGPLVEGIRIVTNEDATGRGELEFHSERSFQRDEPIRGLALYAQTVPAQTGATRFVDCAAAYRERSRSRSEPNCTSAISCTVMTRAFASARRTTVPRCPRVAGGRSTPPCCSTR